MGTGCRPMTAPTLHTSTLYIPAQHPSLAGHFPGNPLLPGVVLLDVALQHLMEDIPLQNCRLENIKFLRPVVPDAVTGVSLTLQYTHSTNGTVRFTIAEAEHMVVSGIVHA